MYDYDKVKEGVKLILEGIGEDLTREGLLDTPDRVARMYQEIFSGMRKMPGNICQKSLRQQAMRW